MAGCMRRMLTILLGIGLLGVAAVALLGAPGLSPGFKRTKKGSNTPVGSGRRGASVRS